MPGRGRWKDPTWLDRQLARVRQSTSEIEALMARQQAAFTAAWERYCERFSKRYPRQVKSMRLRLEKRRRPHTSVKRYAQKRRGLRL